MKSSILLAASTCIALVVATPALGKPGGNGRGQGIGNGRGVGNGVMVVPGRDVRATRGPNALRGPNYGVNTCPPGLAAKLNGCLPPGQARRLFNIGQRIPRGYGFYTPLDNIPLTYRNQIPGTYLGGNYDYIYRNNSIYVVDPTSRLVADIIGLAL